MTFEDVARRLLKDGSRIIDRQRRAQLRVPTEARGTGEPTIYFMTPDYDLPSGGIRVIYRHVDILNRAGIAAFVVHQRRGFKCSWFAHGTRVTHVGAIGVRSNDLVVLSELETHIVGRLPPSARTVIFNQNSHLTWSKYSGVDFQLRAPGREVVGIITVSAHNEAMLRYAFAGVDIRRIHLSIDQQDFHPGKNPKSQRISYMPRRAGKDADQVIQILRSRGAIKEWELVPLDGLRHADIARELQKSAIFLAFTYQEGFGLPAAEAMACGNYVVGYHGFGGREFFCPQFSAPIETGDVMWFARAVEEAIEKQKSNPDWCRARGLEASAFVLDMYAPATEEAEVLAIYTEWLAGDHLSWCGSALKPRYYDRALPGAAGSSIGKRS